MPLKRDPSKALQIGFLTLLVISSAQVAWWIGETIQHTHVVEERLVALYEAEAGALSSVHDSDKVMAFKELLPHLELDPATNASRVKQSALDALHDEADRRVNRYLWEGGFFMLVLILGMTILTTAIRHDSELRRRQQNFLAAISHEFKSPLASIRLSAETLALRSTEELGQRLSARILEDNERLLRMVNNLLDTARLEEGRQHFQSRPTALEPAVRTCVGEVAERARQHGIAIEFDVLPALTVSVDPDALAIVLRNLLDNAIKACIAGDGHSIRITTRQDTDGIVLEVTDDGLGFPPEFAGLMFEKFYRIGDELRRATPGTGLGLYIVKRLVERSGARIRAHSEGDRRGATIAITWSGKSVA